MGIDRIYQTVGCQECGTEMKPGELLVSDICDKCRKPIKISPMNNINPALFLKPK